MRRAFILLILVITLTLTLCEFRSIARSKQTYIVVAAGEFDRRETVVSFALPQDLKGKSYILRDETGQVIPLQVGADRQATFVLAELKSGATKRYRLEEFKSRKPVQTKPCNYSVTRTSSMLK